MAPLVVATAGGPVGLEERHRVGAVDVGARRRPRVLCAEDRPPRSHQTGPVSYKYLCTVHTTSTVHTASTRILRLTSFLVERLHNLQCAGQAVCDAA